MDLEEKYQALSDYDEHEDGAVKTLPNFIPPDAQKTPAATAADRADQMAVEPVEQQDNKAQPPQIDGVYGNSAVSQDLAASTAGGAGQPPADQKADAESEAATKTEQERSNEDVKDAVHEDVAPMTKDDAAAQGDNVTLDRQTYEAIMSVVRKLQEGAKLVDPDVLRQVNGVVQRGGMIHGDVQTQGQQQVKTGAQALAEGGMSLIGGAAALTGAALKAGGKVASMLAEALRERDGSEAREAPAVGVAVLPRISEYRVDQAEKAANAYEDAMQKLWTSGNLPNVRKEIEERARKTGLSVEDVMDKMKPNGEMSDLYEKLCAAVAESQDARINKKAMDKALDSWVRHYGRGQEELLNPESDGSPHFEALRDRLDVTRERMLKNTANAPLFEGEYKSHAEKLREAIQRVMEKLKEIACGIVNMVRGTKGMNSSLDY